VRKRRVSISRICKSIAISPQSRTLSRHLTKLEDNEVTLDFFRATIEAHQHPRGLLNWELEQDMGHLLRRSMALPNQVQHPRHERQEGCSVVDVLRPLLLIRSGSGSTVWEEANDPGRLLVAILYNMHSGRRDGIMERLSTHALDELWTLTVDVMQECREGRSSLQGMDSTTFGTFASVIALFNM
jgi:hypothetical protein